MQQIAFAFIHVSDFALVRYNSFEDQRLTLNVTQNDHILSFQLIQDLFFVSQTPAHQMSPKLSYSMLKISPGKSLGVSPQKPIKCCWCVCCINRKIYGQSSAPPWLRCSSGVLRFNLYIALARSRIVLRCETMRKWRANLTGKGQGNINWWIIVVIFLWGHCLSEIKIKDRSTSPGKSHNSNP